MCHGCFLHTLLHVGPWDQFYLSGLFTGLRETRLYANSRSVYIEGVQAHVIPSSEHVTVVCHPRSSFTAVSCASHCTSLPRGRTLSEIKLYLPCHSRFPHVVWPVEKRIQPIHTA